MADSNGTNRLDLAVDFALGLLSEEEERALLAEARNDPELETLLREQCATREQACSVDAVGLAPKSHPVRSRRPMFWAAGAALAAVLALFILFQPRPEPGQYWMPVDEVTSLQRGAEGGAADLRDGLVAYDARNLDQAIASLQEVSVPGAVNDLRNLYLASALLNSGRRQEARQVLGRVDLATLPYPWRERGQKLEELCGAESR